MSVPKKLEYHETAMKGIYKIRAVYEENGVKKILSFADDLSKDEAIEIYRRYNAFEGLLNACNAFEDLLDACKTSLGAFDALKTIGAHLHLPGYDHCLKIINAAIEKAKEK